MVGSFAPQPPEFSVSGLGSTPKPFHLITNAAALRLGHFLRRSLVSDRDVLGSILQSSSKLSKRISCLWINPTRAALAKTCSQPVSQLSQPGKQPDAIRFLAFTHSWGSDLCIPHLGHVVNLNHVSHGGSHQFEWFKFPLWSHDTWTTMFSSCMLFFGGEGSKTNFGDQEKAYLRTPMRGPVNRRRLTDILLATNLLVYIAQVASQGQVLMWGAKINGLIDKGELWRLVTSSFLHANVGHLMINCYSLNSIGPTMEYLSGPRRYLAIYMSSAIASSTMSYWFSKAPAVGASGAIFGLVGSFAVFVLRHNNMVKGGVGDLKHVARVIALNMAIGLLSQGIDNWGHLGGLIGGIATSWLIGPAWKYESASRHGRRVLVDRAPIFSLPGTKRASQ